MDAVLYQNLREELQQDASRFERQLEEFRGVESFLLGRIKSSHHLSSYRVVLNDMAFKITQSEERLLEVLHLSRFVTRSLIASYSCEPEGVCVIPRTEPMDSIENAIPTAEELGNSGKSETVVERLRLPADGNPSEKTTNGPPSASIVGRDQERNASPSHFSPNSEPSDSDDEGSLASISQLAGARSKNGDRSPEMSSAQNGRGIAKRSK